MSQIPVIRYALQVATNIPMQPGAFRVGVSIQLQQNGPFQPLPVSSPDEFMALVAVIEAPGNLIFDPQNSTLEKVGP